MNKNLTDPATNKTYTFKGFTPIRRIIDHCKVDRHLDCMTAPQDLAAMFGFDFAKNACCLCQCHFTKKALL